MDTSGGDRTHDKLIKSHAGTLRVAGFFQSAPCFGTILAESNAEADSAPHLRGSAHLEPDAPALPTAGMVGVALHTSEVTVAVRSGGGDPTMGEAVDDDVAGLDVCSRSLFCPGRCILRE